MNKKQLINEIMDLCDENERLKNKLNSYEKQNECVMVDTEAVETEKEKTIKELEKQAKKLLLNNIIYDWHLPRVAVKEDSGEFNFLTYEQWVKALDLNNTINSSYKYLFEIFTYTEIKEFFKEQLTELYKEKVNNKKIEIVRSKKDE